MVIGGKSMEYLTYINFVLVLILIALKVWELSCKHDLVYVNKKINWKYAYTKEGQILVPEAIHIFKCEKCNRIVRKVINV